MARLLRVEFSGAIYHVNCRTIGDWRTEKVYLFRDDADRLRFLARLSERVEQYNIRLYLFVLMANHFHLVFETPQGNCSKFMQSLSTAYTVYYNRRHQRHGHLLGGRYKAKLVEGDEYLLALSRYVHLNPVQVGEMEKKPRDERIRWLRSYRWSSYPGYIGRRKALDFIDYGPMLAEMAGLRREQPRRYRVFVESALVKPDEDFKEALVASPRSIGSDSFRTWVDEIYQELVAGRSRPEDLSFRQITEPLAAGVVLEVLAEVLRVEVDAFRNRQRDSVLRAIASRCLCRYAGFTQREVADELRVGTGAAISHQLAKLAAELPKDGSLRRRLKEAERKLQTRRRQSH